MPRFEISCRYFQLAHTVETEAPHVTLLEDHYGHSYSVTMLVKGSGTCFVEGKTYLLKDGDLIALAPNELRSFHYNHGEHHECLTIYFTSSFMTPLLEYETDLLKPFNGHPPGMSNIYNLSEMGEEAAAIIRLICRVAARYNEESSVRDEARLHLLTLDLLFVLSECYEKRGLPKITSDVNSPVWEICRYIHEHLSEPLNYQSIQKALHVGRYCLSVLFRQSTGMTLTEFILQKRLMKVSELVQNGCSISKAAEAVGFRNYSHFYKIFVNRRHVSPQKYYAAQNAAYENKGEKHNG